MTGRVRDRIAAPAIGLASLLVAAGAAVGVVVALPVGPPASLSTPEPVRSVAVTERTDPDERQVQLVLDTGAPGALVTARTGVVTSSTCTAGGTLRSGTEVVRIDEVPVLALASSTPLYRDLSEGDRGDDVRGLQQELARLGSRITVDGVVGPGTIRAVRELLVAQGSARATAVPDDVIERAVFAWIPAPEVSVTACDAVVGATIGPEGVLATLPAALRSARLEQLPVDAVPGARRVRVGQAVVPVDERGLVSDPAALEALRTQPEYAAVLASTDGAPSVPATWTLAEPLRVLVVPPSSLWDIRDGSACVRPVPGAPTLVEVVGSELGQSFVRLPSGERLTRVRSEPDGERPCR
ncbi:peptidoglycan-binding domain-containing protein [Curtobacterium sp. 260]|uniref:peptidoglycan-binding domain-containing protein n=1 Tax=Curtobacterium sp. 260 TaxID=2817748 RepID=UPI0027824062|nr:peptidoglycan-binding domain-containing protein [Curtobacterium sp. 260]MDP9736914.1 peptidoglycan hydrolase-like protein with peptidoglycan-binding domain [Curtobacterium sp. 260]